MPKVTNATGSLLVTIRDKETLDLYLEEQIFGALVSPPGTRSLSRTTLYKILANYACARAGTHALFLYKQEIVYAGEIVGNSQFGSFYLNGETSPIGKKAKASLLWDESVRYVGTPRPGIFKVRRKDKCQPAVILFNFNPGLTRRCISADDFYLRLASYPYLLPSKVRTDLGVWTLTPGETQVALDMFSVSPRILEPLKVPLQVVKGDNPILFDKRYGVKDLETAYAGNELSSKEHLQFSIISNSQLLPASLRPFVSDAICIQVPLSPPTPYPIDRSDICYYVGDDMINDWTLPNRIVSLKTGPANERDVEQVEIQMKWLKRIAEPAAFQRIKAYLFAPSFLEGALAYQSIFGDQIKLAEFSGSLHSI